MDIAFGRTRVKRRRRPKPPKFNWEAFGFLMSIAVVICSCVAWDALRGNAIDLGRTTISVTTVSVLFLAIRERWWRR